MLGANRLESLVDTEGPTPISVELGIFMELRRRLSVAQVSGGLEITNGEQLSLKKGVDDADEWNTFRFVVTTNYFAGRCV